MWLWHSHSEVAQSHALCLLSSADTASRVIQNLYWYSTWCNKIPVDEQVNSQQHQCLVHCRPQFWVSIQKKERKLLLQLEFERSWCYQWSGGVVEEAVIINCLSLGSCTCCRTHLRKSISTESGQLLKISDSFKLRQAKQNTYKGHEIV